MATELVVLTDLFEVSHGDKFDLNKMERCGVNDEGAVAFVGRSGESNGLVAFVKLLPDRTPHEAGLITVALGGRALSSFVQSRRFYTAQNIDVLKPRSKMRLDAKLYYCLCIEANRFRYSTYGREANRTLRTLMLPRSVPAWASGAVRRAAEALSQDVSTVIQSDVPSDSLG
jgi:Type I restriction modification DNA specificity domain